LTFSAIKSRTPRNCSGAIAFGQATFQSSRTLARRGGHNSPQPIVTATSNSTSGRAEVRPDLKDLTFSEGGPKAWFSVIRRVA